MSLDWILDDTNANYARVSTFFLKGSDGKMFQALLAVTVSVVTTLHCA